MKDIRYIPHYNQDKGCWEVEFPNRATEEGDLLYVACEYLCTSAVLHDPAGFSIEGHEKYYSQQERDLLAKLQEKLKLEM